MVAASSGCNLSACRSGSSISSLRTMLCFLCARCFTPFLYRSSALDLPVLRRTGRFLVLHGRWCLSSLFVYHFSCIIFSHAIASQRAVAEERFQGIRRIHAQVSQVGLLLLMRLCFAFSFHHGYRSRCCVLSSWGVCIPLHVLGCSGEPHL